MKQLTALLVICILFSCHPEQKIARDDQKAVDRVRAKEPLVEQVTNEYFKTHPPLTKDSVRIDSVIQIKHDTIPKLIKIPYIVYKNRVIDTIINNVSIFADSTGITIKVLQVNTEETRTRTKETTKEDLSAQYRLQDSLSKYRLMWEGLMHENVQIEKVSAAKDTTIKSKEADIAFANMRFWIAVGIVVGLVIFSIYLKVKSLPTALPSVIKNFFNK